MVRDLPIIAKEGYRPCVDPERIFDIKNLLYFLNEFQRFPFGIIDSGILKDIHEI